MHSALIVCAPGRLRDGLRVMLSAKDGSPATNWPTTAMPHCLNWQRSQPSFVLLVCVFRTAGVARVETNSSSAGRRLAVVWTHTPAQAPPRPLPPSADGVLEARFSSEEDCPMPLNSDYRKQAAHGVALTALEP